MECKTKIWSNGKVGRGTSSPIFWHFPIWNFSNLFVKPYIYCNLETSQKSSCHTTGTVIKPTLLQTNEKQGRKEILISLFCQLPYFHRKSHIVPLFANFWRPHPPLNNVVISTMNGPKHTPLLLWWLCGYESANVHKRCSRDFASLPCHIVFKNLPKIIFYYWISWRLIKVPWLEIKYEIFDF